MVGKYTETPPREDLEANSSQKRVRKERVKVSKRMGRLQIWHRNKHLSIPFLFFLSVFLFIHLTSIAEEYICSHRQRFPDAINGGQEGGGTTQHGGAGEDEEEESDRVTAAKLPEKVQGMRRTM
ncbi:hypothetical protein SDJN02_16966, partial [Cucurbita argyrosperma subsp. argyrosperma]